METINLTQISVFLLQGTLIIALILTLFRLREYMGIGMLFAAMGLFQFLQVFLASTLYFEIYDSVIVSPGSALLYSASIFTVLLIYIKEDAIVARKLVYAILLANIVMIILLYSFNLNIADSETVILENNKNEFFGTNIRIYTIGTLIFFIDTVLLIFLYEFISSFLKSLFLRIILTMMIVLCFDAVVFSIGAFAETSGMKSILISGVVSKFVISILYGFLFTIYLKHFEKEDYLSDNQTFKEIFHMLTYRQKFEKTVEAMEISEQKFKTLTNISPVGIFATAPNGKTEYVNPAWCKISGQTKESALQDGWFDAVHPDDREILRIGWETAVKKKEASYAEYRFIHNDGTIAWVLGQAIPQYSNMNKLIGYVGTTTDITKLKLYENELKKTKEKAEESDRLKTAFLNNISHEIRTPMNGIIGFAKLLKKPKLSEIELKDYLEMIEESSERLLEIINSIVSISEIEAKSPDIVISNFNVNELTKELFSSFKNDCDKKGIELILENSLNYENAHIKTDKGKLTAIIRHLLSNAVKFTKSGSVQFGYTLLDDMFNFFVNDTGIGISDKKMQTIFQPFSQTEYEKYTGYDGIGLGLSIAKSYIELLGGKIKVESILSQGTQFTFTIPRN